MIRKRPCVSALVILTAVAGYPAPTHASIPYWEAVLGDPQNLLVRDINPYDREINLTVPLNFNGRVLGEMPVILTKDDRFLVESEGFVALLRPLLVSEALQDLDRAVQNLEYFAPEDINETGISLVYDPTQLAVLVVRIDPARRTVESLFTTGEPEARGAAPEFFSAFLNSNLSLQRRVRTGDVSTPNLFLNGAVRFGRLVFETDWQGSEDQSDGDYAFNRAYARLVYDQPEAFRRWSLGDLTPELRSRQGFVELGGVGVQRQQRRFDAYRSTTLTGGRRLVLQEASTVRVVRNGALIREFRLEPGQYDVNNLPLSAGSNDVRLEVQSDTGRTESVNYNAYLDLIDLDPGDFEYAAYLGLTNSGFGGQPTYSDGDLVFTGYWRKAFESRPAVGIGLQLSEQVQVLTGQTQLVLGNGSRVQFDGGVSSSNIGQGYLASIAFDHIVDLGNRYDSFTLAAEYTSEDYSYLGSVDGSSTSWTFNGAYSHQFNQRWQASLNASYRLNHAADRDPTYSFSGQTYYRISPVVSIQSGVEYVNYGSLGSSRADGFGYTIGLVWQPRYDRRVDARYTSATNNGNISYQQYSGNRVGSLGYSVSGNYSGGQTSLIGQAGYIGNRFDASVAHLAYGDGLDSVTDEQVTSLRLGASIATAGGKVAIGRNIYDSFAIVSGHQSLGNRPVVVGQGLQGNEYLAKSGPLGPAMTGQLSSYYNQSLRYDVENPPLGYNIGEGVTRVFPTYKSGYVIEVGSNRFVSALGRVLGKNDRPLGLISGRVVPLDSPVEEPQLFFTNSVGRFSVQELEPNKRYRVELNTTPQFAFEFLIPEDNEGLLDLELVRIPVDVPE